MENYIYLRLFVEIAKKFKDNMPLNLIFGEDWLLRLVLIWFDANRNIDHPLSLKTNDFWFAQASLQGYWNKKNIYINEVEGYTKADGIYGDIKFKIDTKTRIELKRNSKRIVVLEAKMFSDFSKNTTNFKKQNYNQVVRTIICIFKCILDNFQKEKNNFGNDIKKYIDSFEKISFFALLPKNKINYETKKIIDIINIKKTMKEHILGNIKKGNHCEDFRKNHEKIYTAFDSIFCKNIEIKLFCWEDIIDFIIKYERETLKTDESKNYGNYLSEFYKYCKKYNKL